MSRKFCARVFVFRGSKTPRRRTKCWRRWRPSIYCPIRRRGKSSSGSSRGSTPKSPRSISTNSTTRPMSALSKKAAFLPTPGAGCDDCDGPIHHEGHEEHELRKNIHPKSSCPSCLRGEVINRTWRIIRTTIRKGTYIMLQGYRIFDADAHGSINPEHVGRSCRNSFARAGRGR